MDSQLQKLIQLPSLPTVAVRLLKIFSDPEVSIADVVYILQTDPALSGKILKAANTSQFGLKNPVSDLQRAVVLLGKKSVMALALGFSLAEASMSKGPYSHLYSDFWFQSLVRGCAASLLAERYTRVDAGEAFTIGLLGRIGRLALLNCDPERFVALREKAEESGIPLDELEAESSEFTSTQISLHLLKEWKLPAHCLAAIREMGSSLEEACGNRASDDVSLTDILRIASAFSEFFSGEHRGLAIAKVYELTSAILQESEQTANELVDEIRQELDDHSELFSVNMSKVGTPMELLSQAMSQLSILAANAAMPREEARAVPCEIMEENGRLRKRVMELTQSSVTDTLTSLYNRNYLMQHLQERAARAAVEGEPVGILFIDVDHFKKVNDTHGHLVGDEVLRVVARTLLETVRESDIVTRYGGEEFVILAASADRPGLERQAERIRRRIETLIVTYSDVRLSVTASLGGALSVPRPCDTTFATQLLEAADSAMYLSKRNGRNRVTIIEGIPPVPNEGEVVLKA